MLGFSFLQYALHSLNHLIDIGETDPSWLGPGKFVLLLLTSVLLAWKLRGEREATAA